MISILQLTIGTIHLANTYKYYNVGAVWFETKVPSDMTGVQYIWFLQNLAVFSPAY